MSGVQMCRRGKCVPVGIKAPCRSKDVCFSLNTTFLRAFRKAISLTVLMLETILKLDVMLLGPEGVFSISPLN